MLMGLTYSPSQCRALRRAGADIGTNCAAPDKFKSVIEKPGTRTAERTDQQKQGKTPTGGGQPANSGGAPAAGTVPSGSTGSGTTGGTSGGGNAGGNGAGCSGSCGNGNGGNGTGNQGGKP